MFVSGMVGWNEDERFESKSFVDQFRQTLLNTTRVLEEAGAKPEHVTRMTWYIVDKNEYLDQAAAVGATYRSIMGKHFPAMAVVVVAGLMEDEARIEIETTAVVPD